MSHDKKYVHLIGQKYRSKIDLLVHGIRSEKDYKKKIVDYYKITEKPGIAGRFVLSQDLFKNGMLIKIRKVKHCAYFLDPSIVLEVEILSEEKYHDHPVEIEIGDPKIKIIEDKNGKAELNSALFELVSTKKEKK